LKTADQQLENVIRGELYSVERLEEYAAYLADELKISVDPLVSQPLLDRMRDNGRRLVEAYRSLTVSIQGKESMPPAAEWLTDNFHIVEDQLREIQEDLPPSYYKELPKLASGDLAGYPRVYGLALALIAHTDSDLEPETIRRFFISYQRTCSLTIGELWALPITLRLVLVENLRRLAVRTVANHQKRNFANLFADQLFDQALDPDKFKMLTAELNRQLEESPQDDIVYTAQLAKRLRDQEREIWPALEVLETYLNKNNSSAESAVHASLQRQVANQVTVANIITSMRLLSSLNWRDFVESLSLVDRILEKDSVFRKLDFQTRDRYRHIIEMLSKKTGSSEIGIADDIIALTLKSNDPKLSHVGYYLIDQGFKKLSQNLGFKQSWLSTSLHVNRNFTYFTLITFLLALILLFPLIYAYNQGARSWTLCGIALLALLPASELALSLTNYILTHIIHPQRLPKLDLSDGIPSDAKTMVIIPCMLAGRKTVIELLEKMEIHYLGNSDPQLSFALVTDYTDADTETTDEDEPLLTFALRGINHLNQKYAAENEYPRFFIFQRRRQWNESENCWMGWERKRGKIHEFNSLLRGKADTSFSVITVPLSFLASIRYVITVDADTRLPRDTAAKLIGTALHPLNRAVFDKTTGRITEGYGILQPRIGVSLESSSRSLFAKIFSGYVGIDPYTTAVSDVYQDLFHEGSYTGKGLYDVDAFEAALKDRFPENTILSHDLLEGIFARTALLSDIEFIDDYPQSYHTFFTRQHRWTRGDWQAMPWFIKSGTPTISRWKIFDNLRRSLVAPTTFLLLALSLISLPGSPGFWFGLVLVLIALPVIIQSGMNSLKLMFGQGEARWGGFFTNIKVHLFQICFHMWFLAHQAVIHIDAIFRVFYRRFISRKRLLEWSTAAQMEKQIGTTKKPLWQSSLPTQLILTVVLFLFTNMHGIDSMGWLVVFLIWMSYPLAAKVISRRQKREQKPIPEEDQNLLRHIARRTWHYFEDFVGSTDNWLPPDNHQQSPIAVTAHRTSPTNIGLYLLSVSSARDFGFITASQMLQRLHQTLQSMVKLERHEGHFLNWYDTKTLAPLHPKYVSTVDSGNLAGYLIVARLTCLDFPKSKIVDSRFLLGLHDIVRIIEYELTPYRESARPLIALLRDCKPRLCEPTTHDFTHWAGNLKSIRQSFEKSKNYILNFKNESSESSESIEDILIWVNLGIDQITTQQSELLEKAPWADDLFVSTEKQLIDIQPILGLKWKQIVRSIRTESDLIHLKDVYKSAIEELAATIRTVGEEKTEAEPLLESLEKLLEQVKQAQAALDKSFQLALSSADIINQLFDEMNFDFLLDKKRDVFSIGYNVSDSSFDRSLYDLLGSEARLASFVAIAKGDVLQEHWFRLGRQLVPSAGGRALVSWTASMFEYLMPNLVLHDYRNTLLNETVHTIVEGQIAYGHEHGIPWGVSEAGYNARDLQMNYQYGPFGVPGFGLKRGLSHDLVISPYSTVLAAMIKPHPAIENMKRLIKNNMLSAYGFFEAIDYTRERLPQNENFAVIRSFMAHHQGMSLVAINNVLHKSIICERFHRDPRIRATQLLLQERIPHGVNPVPPKAAEIEIEVQRQPTNNALIRNYTNPDAVTPRTHLLSNRTYSVMISTAGGGYSKCGDVGVTRWKEDATRDHLGSFIFIKNKTDNELWSSSFQPLPTLPKEYLVTFSEDKAEFRRRDGDVSTHMQIIVAPEDNVEIRHITLTNHSGKAKAIELTSYLEPTLNPPNTDLDHQAFSKLFIQTEYLASKNALLAKRRKRSAHEIENWSLHVVVTDGRVTSNIQYETDRNNFIGRGRSISTAVALRINGNLSNETGAAIDPILSLRIQVELPEYGKIQVAFTTGLTQSKEKALELADRYHDIHAFDRETKRAWTQAQVDLRHLNIDSQSAYLYQRLAERILYSEPSLRPPTHQRVANTNQQASLWPSGIGGDLPIVVVRIDDQKDIPVIRKLLRCHEYLRSKGLIYDFVIINEHDSNYFQDVHDDLQQQIRSTGGQGWLNKNGGIFVLRKNITPARDLAHIQAVARVSLMASEPLEEQINRRPTEEKYPLLASFKFSSKHAVKIAGKKARGNESPLKMDLDFFNGYGGFTRDGREYVMILKRDHWTPAPWINVIGNKKGFGFQISEAGAGFTWNANSQANRLTPWSNDPISDPPGEIVYLRDDETGEVWTPTPLPIRSDEPYIIRHGQGYTVFEHTSHEFEHTLTMFVPVDDTVKISLLKIKNISNRKRKVSVTSYTEWVLGTRREKTAAYLICDIDADSGVIFAKNPHDNEFASKVAFVNISTSDITFTCSRKEFIGRNGNYADPIALKRTGLSKKQGTGQDPCAVLQSSIEIAAGDVFEISILLGQTESKEFARELIQRYENMSKVKKAYTEAIKYWDDLITTVQIKTPEPSLNILMNRWLLYQTLSCRYWARTAFYQSGGAYGFRDQLQDCMAFVYSDPKLAREQIIRASERQFKEGDVQHWWHPPTGRGIRTTMSDDLLWLPLVVSFYIQTTGDKSILNEKTHFIQAPVLNPGQEDSYTQPDISPESATVREHCIRALNRSLPLGQHGLPLIGTGDWNDGMNRIGVQGQGESVWLGWFLYKVLNDFMPHVSEEEQHRYRSHMEQLKTSLEFHGWDGEWYRRAYFDDGTPVGSHLSDECKIDSISQSWAVISKAGEENRIQQAMQNVEKYLVKRDTKLILLLTPPFDKGAKDPGYIKGYIPGVRENGGQYTHAAIWVIMAFAELGQGHKAMEFYNLINPILHSQAQADTLEYKIEPYVLAGDVYGEAPYVGRGGWSWYTGSSSWYYRAALESILGFQLRGDKLKLNPCIPETWRGFEIKYRYQDTQYTIDVRNPSGCQKGAVMIEHDGTTSHEAEISLVNDKREHHIVVTLLDKLLNPPQI
jgi:cyclic beta-1,2-glucan synthetase